MNSPQRKRRRQVVTTSTTIRPRTNSSSSSSESDDSPAMFSKQKARHHITSQTQMTEIPPIPSTTKPTTTTSSSSFLHLGLDSWLLDSLTELNLNTPTPVQIACIPRILSPSTTTTTFLAAAAPTGSGKTAAFALPILDNLARDPYGIYCLVLTPTRELAMQIHEQFQAFGAPIHVRCCVVIGGLPILAQQHALALQPHIVIATPGRFAIHVSSSSTPPALHLTRFLVLDEADRLLDPTQNFLKDIKIINSAMNKNKSLLLFSATLTGENEVQTCIQQGLVQQHITKLDFSYIDPTCHGNNTSTSLHNAPSSTSRLVATLDEKIILVPSYSKHAYVAWFIRHFVTQEVIDASKLKIVHARGSKASAVAVADIGVLRARSIIIFTSTCDQCRLYSKLLINLQIPTVALHSKTTQGRRLAALAKFRSGAIPVLVATDVASRGLDIPTVDLVLNVDVPREPDDYIHRVGRTARAGRRGRAFTFVTPNDVALITAVEAHTRSKMQVFEFDGMDEQIALLLHKASQAKVSALSRMRQEDKERDEKS